MSTSFEGSLGIDEVLVGAPVVAIGSFIEVVDREEVDDGRVFLTYRAVLSDVIAGEPESREVLVRMVDDGEERPEREFLFVLSPDYGRGRDDQYVPYFSPPSPIDKGRYALGDAHVTVDELRERVAKVSTKKARLADALAREEEGQDLDAPYPDVTELGEGRGDTVIDAQLAEPLQPTDLDDVQQSSGKGKDAAE